MCFANNKSPSSHMAQRLITQLFGNIIITFILFCVSFVDRPTCYLYRRMSRTDLRLSSHTLHAWTVSGTLVEWCRTRQSNRSQIAKSQNRVISSSHHTQTRSPTHCMSTQSYRYVNAKRCLAFQQECYTGAYRRSPDGLPSE